MHPDQHIDQQRALYLRNEASSHKHDDRSMAQVQCLTYRSGWLVYQIPTHIQSVVIQQLKSVLILHRNAQDTIKSVGLWPSFKINTRMWCCKQKTTHLAMIIATTSQLFAEWVSTTAAILWKYWVLPIFITQGWGHPEQHASLTVSICTFFSLSHNISIILGKLVKWYVTFWQITKGITLAKFPFPGWITLYAAPINKHSFIRYYSSRHTIRNQGC